MAMAMLYGLYLRANPTNIVDIDRSLLAYTPFFFAGFFVYQSPTLKWYLLKSHLSAIGGIILISSLLLLDSGWVFVGGTIGLTLIAGHFLVMQEKRMFSKFDGIVGDLAYPFYILHIVVISILSDYKLYNIVDSHLDQALHIPVKVAINFTFTIFASYIAWKLIDRPIRKFRLKHTSFTQLEE